MVALHIFKYVPKKAKSRVAALMEKLYLPEITNINISSLKYRKSKIYHNNTCMI